MKDLVVANNLSYCVKLVQQAKTNGVDEKCIRTMIDLLKDMTPMEKEFS